MVTRSSPALWRPWVDENVPPQCCQDGTKETVRWVTTPTSRKQRPRGDVPQPDLPRPKQTRFGTPLSLDELREASKPFVPPQTKRNSDWVYKTFLTWCREHNTAVESDHALIFPEDLFTKKYPLEACKRSYMSPLGYVTTIYMYICTCIYLHVHVHVFSRI